MEAASIAEFRRLLVLTCITWSLEDSCFVPFYIPANFKLLVSLLFLICGEQHFVFFSGTLAPSLSTSYQKVNVYLSISPHTSDPIISSSSFEWECVLLSLILLCDQKGRKLVRKREVEKNANCLGRLGNNAKVKDMRMEKKRKI